MLGSALVYTIHIFSLLNQYWTLPVEGKWRKVTQLCLWFFFSYFSKSRSGTILCLKCSVAGISYFKDQAGGEKETGGYYWEKYMRTNPEMEKHISVKLYYNTVCSLTSCNQKNWKKFSHTKPLPSIILPQQHFFFFLKPINYSWIKFLPIGYLKLDNKSNLR